MAYVYRHIRKDKNEVFYVGIGKDEEGDYLRAYSKYGRNPHWERITQKTDYEVHIMFDDFKWEESCEKEREFIKLYGRRDLGLGTLVNLTDGGEGAVGRIYSEEHKAKIGSRHAGKIVSEETRVKMRKAKIGTTHSKETKDKIGKYNKGKIVSEETRVKLREGKLGKTRQKEECPHCGKIGGVGMMRRWHFDNCKKK